MKTYLPILTAFVFLFTVGCSKPDSIIRYKVEYDLDGGARNNTYTEITYTSNWNCRTVYQFGVEDYELEFNASPGQELLFTMECFNVSEYPVEGRINITATEETEGIKKTIWSSTESVIFCTTCGSKTWHYEYVLED